MLSGSGGTGLRTVRYFQVFHRNGMDLTEAEDIKKRWQKYTYKKDLHDSYNHDGVITLLEETSWNVKSSGP